MFLAPEANPAQAPRALDALREFARRLPPAAIVLDAGCGTGEDLRFLREAGFEAEGLDRSPENVEVARARSGCRVWQADLLLLRLEKGRYDGIWAHRVFPELPLPGCQRVMGSFFAALKPGGHLFASIEGAGERTAFPGPDDFAALLRQSGFQPLSRGESLAGPATVGFIARRI